MWSYDPLVTPVGKPVNVGTDVATPAVLTPGSAVQQWMCDAVFAATRPLNESCTCMVLATVSKWISANPVAGDTFGGASFSPLRSAMKLMIVAFALGAIPTKRSDRTAKPEILIMPLLHGVDTHEAPGGLNHARSVLTLKIL